VATATDNCVADVKLTSLDVTTAGLCSTLVTRTWTATDTCGNKTTATQTINVIDKTGPTTNTDFTTPLNVIVMRFQLNLILYLWIIVQLSLLLFYREH
jgi:hypothetical protein